MVGFLNGKSICLITGGSRGFGRSIAESLFQNEGLLCKASPDSKVILMARTLNGLEETKDLILKSCNSSSEVSVDIVSVDMQDLDAVTRAVQNLLESNLTDFDNVIIFNNAASVGDVTKTLIEHDSIRKIQDHFNINVVSPMYIISKFCKHYINSKRFVVHISSLTAIKTFRYMGLYSSMKACMDMFTKNLTADCPSIRALNYAPGPMDTDMSMDIKQNCGHAPMREWLTQSIKDGTIIQCSDSVKKLMSVLKKDDYQSGSHIDFYDI